ncbi:MAG: hypothetical protein SF066_19155 [Thermoanaerobaculia bacterium]|nr:hypothetical protein [Thermoanaerobaculia bacterium]
MKRIFLCLWFFAAPDVWAQAERVTDINTAHTGAAATAIYFENYLVGREMLTVQGRLWFTADDGVHGVELWITDGSTSGTRRVTDLCPGRCSAHPRALAGLGTSLFFIADDGIHGTEPWISDGTTAGTRLLADVAAGLGDVTQDIAWAVTTDTLVIFGGRAPATGTELWVTDGTPAGTRLLKDLWPGPAPGSPRGVARLGPLAFFSATDGRSGFELWRTDGTEAGTIMLEIAPGSASGFFLVGEEQVATSDGLLFFPGKTTTLGRELWKSDGTPGNTRLVKDVTPGSVGSDLFDLTAHGKNVYFVNGHELWASDGSEAGTRRLLGPGSGAGPWNLVGAEPGLFFEYSPSSGQAAELWISDGTAVGTRSVTGTPVFPSVSAGKGVVAGAGMLFFGFDLDHGIEPWYSDGTAAGTLRLADLAPGQESAFIPGEETRGHRLDSLDGRGYFWAYSPTTDFELWSSDGTAEGTTLLQDTNAAASSLLAEDLSLTFSLTYSPVSPAATPTGLVFPAADGPVDPLRPALGTTGLELWHIDHESRAVASLGDLEPGPSSFLPIAMVSTDVGVLFSDAAGQLWNSTGDPATTAPLSGVPSAGRLACLPGAIVAASSPPLAFSLDLLSVTPLPLSGSNLTSDGVRAFLTGTQAVGVTDGTILGSRELLLSDTSAESPVALGAGNAVGFIGGTTAAGREPWVWREGTASLLRDVLPGGLPSFASLPPRNFEFEGRFATLHGAGPLAFFRADDGLHGEELWATDGNTPGTRLVAEIFPGPRGADLRRLTPVGSRVYFVADDGVHGRELWLSDGTAAGTRLVRDLAPGPGSATPQELTAIGGFLVFNAWTPEHGRELWISDGTTVGTRRLTDIAPGPLSSSPVTFVAAGGWLYFTANDNVTGDELWRLPLGLLQPGTIFADGFESGNLSAWSTP